MIGKEGALCFPPMTPILVTLIYIFLNVSLSLNHTFVPPLASRTTITGAFRRAG